MSAPPMALASPPTAGRNLYFSLEADLTEDARFGRRILEADDASIKVLGDAGETILNVLVEELRGARTESLVSGGRLILEMKSGEEVVAITYSETHGRIFGDAAHLIERLAEGEEIDVKLEQPSHRCKNCGKLLPDKDGVCPSCVNRGQTMLRITQFLGPYKKGAFLLGVYALSATALTLLPPYLQGQIIKNLESANKDIGFLWGTLGIWLGALILGAFLLIMQNRTMTRLAVNISADLRNAVYRAIEFLQVEYFDRKPVGAIASRVTTDTDRVWGFLVDGLPFFITNGLVLLGVLAYLFSVNWVLAICVLIPFPIVAAISMKVWKPISGNFHKVSQKWARVHMHIGETLMGVRVMKAFANEDHEYKKFKSRNAELRDAAAYADEQWFTAYGFMSLCATSGVVVNWAVGGWMLYNGTLSLGDFWAVNAYLALVYGPLEYFARINNWFSRAMAGAERIFEILDMTPEAEGGTGITHKVEGRVQFDEVRFGYDKSNPIIQRVSFDVKPGEMIGLVGRSGAGKSTTINLVTRFYDPDAGRILVDGVDLREINLHDYRAQIGIVLQEPFLFHGTISENISYGRPGADFNEIVAAARAANAHDFILAKPEGYDTVVGERGARLSGGEKQRISIARAILHNPKILILDEATSSVDVETEKQIQEAIQVLVTGRTTFAIAHRLSTLRHADRLFVMENGRIAEEGSHEELMERRGIFHELVETQRQASEVMGVGA